jgi:hypothetical protein
MDDKYERIRTDFNWYLKLLNSLCGKYEEWGVRKGRKPHACEFGHPISPGARYLRKLFGPDRAEDVKLCEDCGVKFMHLLFGAGGGTAELASRLLRDRYGSLLIALKQIERNRVEGREETTRPEPPRSPAAPLESGSAPKWSAERLAEMRRKYTRAYEKWTTAEDDRLKDMNSTGVAVAQMARELQRQPSAIRSRLKKLGLAGDSDSSLSGIPGT